MKANNKEIEQLMKDLKKITKDFSIDRIKYSIETLLNNSYMEYDVCWNIHMAKCPEFLSDKIDEIDTVIDHTRSIKSRSRTVGALYDDFKFINEMNIELETLKQVKFLLTRITKLTHKNEQN